jgi:hypothetical protein
MAYLAFGLLALLLLYALARGFLAVPAPQLAYGLKTFAAAFTALAGTGLLFTGRIGLAFVTLAATAVAVRALLLGPRGADPLRGKSASDQSSVETEWLAMRLDHTTGEAEGWIKHGVAAGRELASLGVGALLRLRAELQREDPPAVPLLEAYLDRRFPDWRVEAEEAGPGPATPPAGLDERTALEILGLARGATEAEIKSAHRTLMSRLHPDHGGTAWLAAQLNQARDFLLNRR